MTVQAQAQINSRLIYFSLFVISGLFILLFSRSTSPIYVYYTPDSSIFMSIGKQILEGKVLYSECFDHKGPVVLFFQAFAQLIIPVRMGICVFQIINLFTALVFLYKTSNVITGNCYKNILVVISFLVYFRFTIGEGNRTEEYSLFFSFVSLYITFRYYYLAKELSKSDIFMLSMCFSLVFWISPNNTGIILSCFILIFLLHSRAKKWAFNFDLIHIFLVCFLTFSAFISLYFIKNNTFEDMIYAFSLNLKYLFSAFEYSGKSLLTYLFSSLLIIIVFVGGIAAMSEMKKEKNLIFLIIIAVLLLFAFISLYLGSHFYIAILAPAFSIGVMLFLRNRTFTTIQTRVILFSSLCLATFLTLSSLFKFDYYKDHDLPYIVCARDIVSKIPERDREKTFGYQVDAKLFVTTDLKPTFRFYFYQEQQGNLDTNIINAVNEKIEAESTLWVITQNDLMAKSTNTLGKIVLKTEYDLYLQDKYFKLYKRKKPKQND